MAPQPLHIAAVSWLIPAHSLAPLQGSGKTTFINHILTGNHGKKIAIIENEVMPHTPPH